MQTLTAQSIVGESPTTKKQSISMNKKEESAPRLSNQSADDTLAVEKRLDAIKNELRRQLSALRYRVECVARS